MNELEARKTEVFRDGNWIEIDFLNLKKGENFRLFEQTGEEVYNLSGMTIFQSISSPYENENGIWQIDII